MICIQYKQDITPNSTYVYSYGLDYISALYSFVGSVVCGQVFRKISRTAYNEIYW